MEWMSTVYDPTKRCCRCHRVLSVLEFTLNRTTRDGYEPECRECKRNRSWHLSLDKVIAKGAKSTYADYTATRVWKEDSTYEKVIRALAYWIEKRILTAAQAEAIYLHAVELFTFEEIAEMTDLSRKTAYYHYDTGIKKLRKRYVDKERLVS